MQYAGADPGFQVRGARFKKLRRAEGGGKILGVFRVKNHNFMPKNHIFPILGGRACAPGSPLIITNFISMMMQLMLIHQG